MPQGRDDDHRPALHGRRIDQAPHGFVAEEHDQHGQGHAVDLRREDLGALEPVGVGAGRGSGGQPDREQRERDRARVGEHVPGVGEQGQGARREADDDLDDHQPEDQDQGAEQVAPVGARPDAVDVADVPAAHGPARVTTRRTSAASQSSGSVTARTTPSRSVNAWASDPLESS